MIGLDTNILIRYLTQDDPLQSPKASRIIERDLTEEEPGFVSLATVLETAWVLEKIYNHSGRRLAETIEKILQIRTLVVQNEKEVHTAIFALRTDKATFDDALIGALGVWAGCDHTLTFDKKASHLPGFKLIV